MLHSRPEGIIGEEVFMNAGTSTAAKKLGIKLGAHLTVIGMAPDEVSTLLGGVPDGVTLNGGSSELSDIVLLFAADLEAVRCQVMTAHEQTAPSGRLWVAYRKGQSRKPDGQQPDEVLHRDTLQKVLGEHGLDGVTLIAIDDTWSAMRVRPARGQQ